MDTARARSLWHAGGTVGEDDDGSQGRVADLAAEGHLDALSADPDPAAPRRHRSRAALAGADPRWYRPLAMRQWLLQRQPGLVARLRVDTGATGALQPSSAALERRTLRVGVTLAAALTALQSIAHLINVVAFDLSIDMVNAGSDSSVFAWASSVATFGAALLLCLLAIVRPTRPWPLVALAGAAAFMSLDDIVGLHERVSRLGTTLGPTEHFNRIFWPLAYMPLLAATFVGLFGVAAGLRVAPARALLAGLTSLVVAIALEMASPILFALGSGHGELAYELEVVLEEGAELAGWTLVSTGLATALLTSAPPASRG